MVIATETAIPAVIQWVSPKDVDPNPFRKLGEYPYIESKIETLMRSVAEVGLWEGIIARRRGNRLQAAFGHHRLEAARRLGVDKIPVIIRELDEEQMIMFMGRENGEDYNSDFVSMLETWEAGIAYLKKLKNKTDRMTVASLLGWTRIDTGHDNVERPNQLADACDLACQLIEAGHYDRQSFVGMPASAVLDIVQIQTARLNRVDKVAKNFQWDEGKVKKAKGAVVVSGKQAMKAYKAGEIGQKHIRSRADDFFLENKSVRKEPALLNMAIQPLISRIDNLLNSESADGKKLDQLAALLPGIVRDLTGDDERALDGLKVALVHLGKRASTRSHQIDRDKVVPLAGAKRLAIAKE